MTALPPPSALRPLALALLFGLGGCAERPGTVEGRVVSRGEAAPGIAVEAWTQAEKRPGASPFAAVETDPAGAFSLSLPAGAYWLMARDLSAAPGPRRIAEFPGNPIRLAPGARVQAGEVEVREAGAPGPPAAGSGIRGRALLGSGPAPDAAVAVYPAGRERLAGPGYVALVRTGADGSFLVDLPPGAYRIAVRLRGGGATAGRLREGDASGMVDRPLEVPRGKVLDVGDVPLHAVDPARLAAEAERGFQPSAATALEGRVLDRGGKPRPGLFVFVYRDEGMIGRPEAVSETGPDGAFVLSLPGAGRYFVGARSGRGGPRQPGEWSGTLEGGPVGGLEVPEGRRVKGLTVIVAQEW